MHCAQYTGWSAHCYEIRVAIRLILALKRGYTVQLACNLRAYRYFEKFDFTLDNISKLLYFEYLKNIQSLEQSSSQRTFLDSHLVKVKHLFK